MEVTLAKEYRAIREDLLHCLDLIPVTHDIMHVWG